jgi:DNA-binding PadR family transcriptional regulator
MLTEYGDIRHSSRMGPEPDAESFLPLPASVMHIIVALANGDKHGYAIMRDIADVSDGVVRMGSGTLYGSIKRMLDQGLIEEAEQRPDPALDDERRRYYRLTQFGHRVGAAEHRRLSALVDAGRLRQLGILHCGVR